MFFSRLVGHGTKITASLIIALALINVFPGPVQAQPPVDLELDTAGATPWSISNIKPGDSGTKVVELHNAGDEKGFVTIWISDIVESDHGGDGAALGDYLRFNVACSRLNTNIALPAAIRGLPQSSNSGNYLRINSLDAGETVTLVWGWAFPETGQPQNNAQGDGLSFTINYMIEESPIGGGVPSYQGLEIDVMGHTTYAEINPLGEILGSCVATDPDKKHKLEFDKGTRITCINGGVPWKIEMRVSQDSPAAPDGAEIIGPNYELIGYPYNSTPGPVTFSQPVKLTLSYDFSWLPANTDSINIAFYDAAQGWKDLELPEGSPAAWGTVNALIDRTSIFAILARVSPVSPPVSPHSPPSTPVLPVPPSPEPPPPVPAPPAPAKFELGGLAINPAQAGVGEPVGISVVVQNTGELESGYTLNLEIDGSLEQSKEVALPGGESTQVVFVVVRDEPGTYTIAIDGLTGEFTVLAPELSQDRHNNYWWAISLAVIAVGLLGYFLTQNRAPRA
jgi:hypothetical protein